MAGVISGMFLDQTVGEQMSTLNINEPPYNLDGALLEWGNDLVLSDTDFSGSAPFSSQETSQLSSLSPESSQSRSEDATLLNDQDEICYGMVSQGLSPNLYLLTKGIPAAQPRRQIGRRNASHPL